MPVYEYRCSSCGVDFELERPMNESSSAATCPHGHDGAVRRLSVFAAVGSAAGAARAPSPGAAGMSGPCGSHCACHG